MSDFIDWSHAIPDGLDRLAAGDPPTTLTPAQAAVLTEAATILRGLTIVGQPTDPFPKVTESLQPRTSDDQDKYQGQD